jgi:L-lactate utilization protein LutC
MKHSELIPNQAFAKLASDEQVAQVAKALEANNIHTLVVDNGEEAKAALWKLIPEGSEVFTNASRTLDTLGIPAEVDKRYDSVRVKLAQMNRETQNREMIKMGAVPQYILGSVHAVTKDGTVIVASNTGSQLAPYAASAEHVIWLVGTQKIVSSLEEGMKRVREYTYPLEDERALQTYGMNSFISKWLIVHREVMPGRTTMILIKENLGF